MKELRLLHLCVQGEGLFTDLEFRLTLTVDKNLKILDKHLFAKRRTTFRYPLTLSGVEERTTDLRNLFRNTL